MGSASPLVPSIRGVIWYADGVFVVLVGDGALQGMDGHGQLGSVSGNPSDSVQGGQATDVVHVADSGSHI